MPGRIATYLHSDSVSSNKGGSLVKITCETDFLAKAEIFQIFCDKVAKMAYAASVGKGSIVSWKDIIVAFPFMENELNTLQSETKEKIDVQHAIIQKIIEEVIKEVTTEVVGEDLI